jgi:superfamily II DNA/RNA helicase
MIVATPGRLIDHMERGRINFSRLELLVVDEADRMLDIGFSEAVKTIAATTPVSRQTLLFAATWDKSVEKLAQHILKSPVRVEIAGKKVTLEEIEQRLHTADSRSHKNRILKHLIADSSMTRAIIFSSTKRNADSLARELYNQGHAAAALHGDMKQNARNRTTMNMRRGKIRLLVATDVAVEDYVHRIGRTGRAGASGIAISLASSHELDALLRIERYIGQTLPQHVIPGLEPARTVHHPNGNGNKRRQPAKNRGGNGRGRRFGQKFSSSRSFVSGSK